MHAGLKGAITTIAVLEASSLESSLGSPPQKSSESPSLVGVFLPHPVNSIFSWDRCSSCGSFRKVITSKKNLQNTCWISIKFDIKQRSLHYQPKQGIIREKSPKTTIHLHQVRFFPKGSHSMMPIKSGSAHPQINECREHFKRKGSSSSLIVNFLGRNRII